MGRHASWYKPLENIGQRKTLKSGGSEKLMFSRQLAPKFLASKCGVLTTRNSC